MVLGSSGTEIVIPAHSLLPARDISRACLGSERRASLRGLAGEGSGEGPYGRTPAESGSFHGRQRDAWERSTSWEVELKPRQHLHVLLLGQGAAMGRICLGSVEIAAAIASS